MNSKHSIFKVLVLTVALFVGCNQEETNDLQVTSETVNGFLKYELDKSSLAFNEEDKDDEAINWKLIEIAGKLQFIISDVELRQSIASTVQGSVKEYVSLRELSEKFPEVAQLFNQSDFKSGFNDDVFSFLHLGNDYDPRADYRIFFNTFERDWYSSPKDLGEGNAYGSTVFLEGKRKYSNEWYAFDPNNSVDKRLNINLIYSNWLRTFSNSKGYLKVWRVEL